MAESCDSFLNGSTETVPDSLHDANEARYSTPMRDEPSTALPPLHFSPSLSGPDLAFNDLSSTLRSTPIRGVLDSSFMTGLDVSIESTVITEERTVIPEVCRFGVKSLDPYCCRRRCIASINPPLKEKIRTSFMSRSQSDQRQFLFDIIMASAKQSASENLIIDGYVLSGKKVCQKAFSTLLNVSQKRLCMVKKLVESQAVSAKHKLLRPKRKTEKFEIAAAWMEAYFKRIGDQMPHTEQVHLPSFLTKNSIFDQMEEQLKQQGFLQSEIISLSHFYAIWNDCYSHCIIPKVSDNLY